MTANAVPISSRTLPMSPVITAGGGFTTPKNLFIPHPATTPFGMGNRIASPELRGGNIVPNTTITIPRHGLVPSGVYGIRSGSR